MEKFKCIECGVNEVDEEDDICDDCFNELYEEDEDGEFEEDED